MHQLLEKLFEKRGIQGLEDLKGSEKDDFDRWDRVLSEGEMSVDKIKAFCQTQIKQIEAHWTGFEHTDRQVVAHTIYTAILDCISSPQAEKENLEKYLTQLLQ